MEETAAYAAIVCGAVSVLGGLQGWIRKRSRASLIAGCAAGGLLLLAGFLLLGGTDQALYAIPVIGLLLLGRFAPSYIQKKRIWPAGVMTFLSAATVVISAIAMWRAES